MDTSEVVDGVEIPDVVVGDLASDGDLSQVVTEVTNVYVDLTRVEETLAQVQEMQGYYLGAQCVSVGVLLALGVVLVLAVTWK